MSDQDYELLSAYLDGELDVPSQTTLEARLRNEPELQRELDNLRRTVQLLAQLPPLKSPRDFRLTPGMVQVNPVTEIKPRLWLIPTTAAFSAVSAGAAVILIGLSVVLFQNQSNLSQSTVMNSAPVALQLTVLATDPVTASPEIAMQNAQAETAAGVPSLVPQPTQGLPGELAQEDAAPGDSLELQDSATEFNSTETVDTQLFAMEALVVTEVAGDGMLGSLVAVVPTLVSTVADDAALMAAPAAAESGDAPQASEAASMVAGADMGLTATFDPASAVIGFAADPTGEGLIGEAERSSLTETPVPESAVMPSPAPTQISSFRTTTPPSSTPAPTTTPIPTAAPSMTATSSPVIEEAQVAEASLAPVILLLMGVFLLALAGITTWMRRR